MRVRKSTLLEALVILSVLIAGCAAFEGAVKSEKARLRTAWDTYGVVTRSLKDAIRADKLDKDEIQKVKMWADRAEKALEKWDEAFRKGGPTETYEEKVQRALAILQGVALDAEIDLGDGYEDYGTSGGDNE